MPKADLPLFLTIIISTWLVVCTFFDLKKQEVPNFLTILPLALSSIYAVFSENGIQIVFLIFLFVISDFPKDLRLPCGLIGILFGLYILPQQAFLFASYFVFWSLWAFEVMGGADVKILMSLLLITQSPSLGWLVLIAGGFLGLVYLIKGRNNFPYTLAITSGTCFFFVSTNY